LEKSRRWRISWNARMKKTFTVAFSGASIVLNVTKEQVEKAAVVVGSQAALGAMSAAAGASLGHALKPDNLHRNLPTIAQVGSAMGAAAAGGAGVSGTVAAGAAVVTAKVAAATAAATAVATIAAPIVAGVAVGAAIGWGFGKLIDAIDREFS
jgi:hypothetical protein